jgi:hypothetical protein
LLVRRKLADGYLAIVSCRIIDRRLPGAVVLRPMYWMMTSAAALKALLQIVITPTLWEKTVQGLEKSRTIARIAAT